MTRKADASLPDWDDEDTPEWTEEQFARAELAIGGVVVRAATGTLTRAGRPPLGAAAKRQVTLRLDPDVIDTFRAGGPGWQGRMNAALRTAAGLEAPGPEETRPDETGATAPPTSASPPA